MVCKHYQKERLGDKILRHCWSTEALHDEEDPFLDLPLKCEFKDHAGACPCGEEGDH